jgi:NAD(P)-dependent dehydrogenase (short-subunit alcohol dehydrogenase family)
LENLRIVNLRDFSRSLSCSLLEQKKNITPLRISRSAHWGTINMFSEKVVIVTGAGSGIGRAAAIKLSSLGATLAVMDISEAALSETIGLCDQSKHLFAAFDVGSTAECNKFVQDTMSRFGRIDYVLNNAGVNPTGTPTEAMTDEYWDKLVNTNLKGIFNITRASIPHLQSGSAIVNVSSIMGSRVSPGFAVYCATKWGVIGFTKSLALELGPKGIRANVVAPGEIKTPTNSFVKQGEAAQKEISQRIALGRMGEADEVVDVVAFLFSDASRYMNGSVVEVNGGFP